MLHDLFHGTLNVADVAWLNLAQSASCLRLTTSSFAPLRASEVAHEISYLELDISNLNLISHLSASESLSFPTVICFFPEELQLTKASRSPFLFDYTTSIHTPIHPLAPPDKGLESSWRTLKMMRTHSEPSVPSFCALQQAIDGCSISGR
jgi:hypothetical protein